MVLRQTRRALRSLAHDQEALAHGLHLNHPAWLRHRERSLLCRMQYRLGKTDIKNVDYPGGRLGRMLVVSPGSAPGARIGDSFALRQDAGCSLGRRRVRRRRALQLVLKLLGHVHRLGVGGRGVVQPLYGGSNGHRRTGLGRPRVVPCRQDGSVRRQGALPSNSVDGDVLNSFDKDGPGGRGLVLAVLVGLERLELLEAQAALVAGQVVAGRGDAHAVLVVRQNPGKREERDGARRVDASGVAPVPKLPLPQRDGRILPKSISHLLMRLALLLVLAHPLLRQRRRGALLLLLQPRVDLDQLDVGDDLRRHTRR